MCKLSDNVPLLEPAHSVAAPEVVPPAEVGLTVMVAEVELAAGQVPFVTFARYPVVEPRFEYACEVVVLGGATGFQEAPPSVDSSQKLTAVKVPESDRFPLLIPEHTVAFAVTDPAEAASTFTWAMEE